MRAGPFESLLQEELTEIQLAMCVEANDHRANFKVKISDAEEAKKWPRERKLAAMHKDQETEEIPSRKGEFTLKSQKGISGMHNARNKHATEGRKTKR